MFTVLLNRRVRVDSPNSPNNGTEGTIVAVSAASDGHFRLVVSPDGNRPMKAHLLGELVLLPVGSQPAVN